jgi:hypothetical protein
MDHEQAVKLHAAERYLLHELSPEECDDFEEHFFVCVQCADEVRSVFTFADNAKGVLEEKSAIRNPQSEISSWWSWLRPAVAASVAGALFLGIALYQSVRVIPRLERELAEANQAQVIPSVVARAATRGEDPVVEISEHDRFVQLILDVNVAAPVSSFICDVVDKAGVLKFSVPAPAPSKGSLNLLLPASGLEAGRYIIRVRPGSGPDSVSQTHVDEYSFVLQRK